MDAAVEAGKITLVPRYKRARPKPAGDVDRPEYLIAVSGTPRTSFVPRPITMVAGRGRWWDRDYQSMRGALPDGRLPSLLRREPGWDPKKIDVGPSQAAPVLRRMARPRQWIPIGVAGAVVLHEGRRENRLSAVNFNGTEIRSFDLPSYREGCAASLRDAAIISALHAAKAAVERNFADVGNLPAEVAPYRPSASVLKAVRDQNEKAILASRGRPRSFSIEEDDDELEAKKIRISRAENGEVVIGEPAFGNQQPIDPFEPEDIESDPDDAVEIIRGTETTAQALEPASEPERGSEEENDIRWRPDKCVIAGKWTSTPSAKASEDPAYRSPFDSLIREVKQINLCTPAEQASLLSTMRECKGVRKKRNEYWKARTRLIEAYSPKVLRIARMCCKSWPHLRKEEVFNELIEHLYRKIDKYSHNRGSFATFVEMAMKSSFIDYVRKIRPPEGITQLGKDQGKLVIKSIQQAIGRDDEGASISLADILDSGDYGDIDHNAAALEAINAPELLTQQDRQVYQRYCLEGRRVEEIAREISKSPQRVYQLIERVRSKIEDYKATLITGSQDNVA